MRFIKNIILHCGMYKTGTTSIQYSLYDSGNAKILVDKGLSYFSAWGANHSHAFGFLYDERYKNNISMVRYGYGKDHDKIRKNFIDSLKTAETMSVDTLLFSSEDLFDFSESALNKLKASFEHNFGDIHFRIIIYVREPISLHISLHQTLIKAGYSGIPTMSNYSRCISTLQNVFDKHNIEIYRFEDAIAYGCPVRHFLSKLGFTSEEINLFKITKSNASMCHIITCALDYLNQKIPKFFDNGNEITLNHERAGFRISPLVRIRGPKFDYNYKLKKELAQNSINEVTWLKKETGIDYSSFLKNFSDNEHDYYDKNTIDDIFEAFPKLDNRMRKIMIEFFESCYADEPRIGLLIKKLKNMSLVLEEIEKKLGSDIDCCAMVNDFVTIFKTDGRNLNEIANYTIPSDRRVNVELYISRTQAVIDIVMKLSIGQSVVFINKILINGKPDNFRIHSNCFEQIGNVFVFLGIYPQIHIACTEPIVTLNLDIIAMPGVSSMEPYFRKIIHSRYNSEEHDK